MSQGSDDHLVQTEDHVLAEHTHFSYPPAMDGNGIHRESFRADGQNRMDSPLMPHMYYDDGPFDAPSSDSEEDTLLEKSFGEREVPSSPGTAERGLGINPELIVGQGKVSLQLSGVSTYH